MSVQHSEQPIISFLNMCGMQTRRIDLMDCYNNVLHKSGKVIGTVVSNFNRYGMTNGWKIIYVDETD